MERLKQAAAMDMDSFRNAELIYVNRSDADKDNWMALKHCHHFLEFFYVTSGAGQFLVEEQQFPIRKNDIVLVNPNVEHTELSDPQQPLEYVVIGISGLLLVEREQPFAYVTMHDSGQQILSYVHNVFEEYTGRQQAYYDICKNLVHILLQLVLRQVVAGLHVVPARKVQRELAQARNYIDLHFKNEITLDLLAGEVHMNKYYLAHAFKKTYGVSPVKYLNMVRINTAKFLLESTSSSIADIAEMVGCNSQSYFSQIFKKETGISPLDYRKLYTG